MTTRQIVEEWLDTFNRGLLGTEEAEILIAQLEEINKAIG